METRQTLRTIELWCGIVAGILALVIPIYGLATNASVSIELGAAIPVIFGLGLSVASGAVLDSQARNIQALCTGIGFLWSGTAPLLLIAAVLFGLPPGSFGIYVLPAALVAVPSAIIGAYSDLTNGVAVQSAASNPTGGAASLLRVGEAPAGERATLL